MDTIIITYVGHILNHTWVAFIILHIILCPHNCSENAFGFKTQFPFLLHRYSPPFVSLLVWSVVDKWESSHSISMPWRSRQYLYNIFFFIFNPSSSEDTYFVFFTAFLLHIHTFCNTFYIHGTFIYSNHITIIHCWT